jgi:hypothetical protein
MKSAHQRHQCHIDAVSEAIRRAGSIGDLERLAGICSCATSFASMRDFVADFCANYVIAGLVLCAD